jgi:hypothetical protein
LTAALNSASFDSVSHVKSGSLRPK